MRTRGAGALGAGVAAPVLARPGREGGGGRPMIEGGGARWGGGHGARSGTCSGATAAAGLLSYEALLSGPGSQGGRRPAAAGDRRCPALPRHAQGAGGALGPRAGAGAARPAWRCRRAPTRWRAYPDGVWLVELAALADPALVPQAVAAAVGVREEPGRPLLATLGRRALRPKRLLLVLDNCEHLLDACARLADALLRACPGLRSWPPAGRRWASPARDGLARALPGPGPAPRRRPPRRGAGARYEAVRLFVDRARGGVQPGFAVTDQNAAGGGPGLRPAGRHPPGPRAGRRAGAGAAGRAAAGAAGGPLPAADRGQPHRPGAPPDAAGDRGLELRPAHRAGAGAVRPAGGLRRRLDAGGGRGGGRRRRIARRGRTCSTC